MSGVGSSPALATCETSQVLLAGVSGGFPGVLLFPPTYRLACLYERDIKLNQKKKEKKSKLKFEPYQEKTCFLYPPQTVFVGGYSRYTVFSLSIRPSVTFCFLNNLKSHGWNLIKPCIHIHIYRANTYNKEIRARGHFYESCFPL